MIKHRVTAVFFDLDGTLLDTAPDLADALNELLIQQRRSTITPEIIRPTVALGTTGILSASFSMGATHPRFATLREEFLSLYYSHLTNKTTYFEGMVEVLDYLDAHQLLWGIVTNKPGWLAKPLLDHFNLTDRYCCLVSGDQLPKRKPDPEQLLYACNTAKVLPHKTVYVGDLESDVIAAKASGMLAIVATYGYLAADNQPQQWKADASIETPRELIDWLLK